MAYRNGGNMYLVVGLIRLISISVIAVIAVVISALIIGGTYLDGRL
jgi:hypothetical protein